MDIHGGWGSRIRTYDVRVKDPHPNMNYPGWIRTNEYAGQSRKCFPLHHGVLFIIFCILIMLFPDRCSQACGSISSFDAPLARTPSLQHASYRRGEHLRPGLCCYQHYATPILKQLINFLRTVIRTATPVQMNWVN